MLEWLSHDGDVIYVSMGTVVELTADMLVSLTLRMYSRNILIAFPLFLQFFLCMQAIMSNAFVRLTSDYRVLWALPAHQQSRLPSLSHLAPSRLLRLETWVTTPAVLSMHKVKLFLTHCGGNGAHEALATGTPMFGIPFFG